MNHFSIKRQGSRKACRLMPGSVFWLCLLLLCAGKAAADDLDFEIDGEVKHTVYSPTGQETKQERFAYKVWLKDRNWMIHMTPLPERNPASIAELLEMGNGEGLIRTLSVFNPEFDNSGPAREMIADLDRILAGLTNASREEIRHLQAEKKDLEKSLKAGTKQTLENSFNKAIGWVSTQLYPEVRSEGPIAFVWFAFCSQDYLDGIRESKLSAIWPDIDTSGPTNTVLSAQVKRGGAGRGLPEEVAFANNGTGWYTGSTGMVFQPFPAPFDKGFTNGFYQVTESTNTATATLPKTFTLDVYGPMRKALGAPLELCLRERFEGTTRAVRSPCDRTNFVPVLPVDTLIQDERFADSARRGLQYYSKAGAWSSSSNVNELMQYQRENRSAIKAKKGRRQLLVTIPLVLLLLAPLPLLMRKKSASQNKNNKQQ